MSRIPVWKPSQGNSAHRKVVPAPQAGDPGRQADSNDHYQHHHSFGAKDRYLLALRSRSEVPKKETLAETEHVQIPKNSQLKKRYLTVSKSTLPSLKEQDDSGAQFQTPTEKAEKLRHRSATDASSKVKPSRDVNIFQSDFDVRASMNDYPRAGSKAGRDSTRSPDTGNVCQLRKSHPSLYKVLEPQPLLSELSQTRVARHSSHAVEDFLAMSPLERDLLHGGDVESRTSLSEDTSTSVEDAEHHGGETSSTLTDDHRADEAFGSTDIHIYPGEASGDGGFSKMSSAERGLFVDQDDDDKKGKPTPLDSAEGDNTFTRENCDKIHSIAEEKTRQVTTELMELSASFDEQYNISSLDKTENDRQENAVISYQDAAFSSASGFRDSPQSTETRGGKLDENHDVSSQQLSPMNFNAGGNETCGFSAGLLDEAEVCFPGGKRKERREDLSPGNAVEESSQAKRLKHEGAFCHPDMIEADEASLLSDVHQGRSCDDASSARAVHCKLEEQNDALDSLLRQLQQNRNEDDQLRLSTANSSVHCHAQERPSIGSNGNAAVDPLESTEEMTALCTETGAAGNDGSRRCQVHLDVDELNKYQVRDGTSVDGIDIGVLEEAERYDCMHVTSERIVDDAHAQRLHREVGNTDMAPAPTQPTHGDMAPALTQPTHGDSGTSLGSTKNDDRSVIKLQEVDQTNDFSNALEHDEYWSPWTELMDSGNALGLNAMEMMEDSENYKGQFGRNMNTSTMGEEPPKFDGNLDSPDRIGRSQDVSGLPLSGDAAHALTPPRVGRGGAENGPLSRDGARGGGVQVAERSAAATGQYLDDILSGLDLNRITEEVKWTFLSDDSSASEDARSYQSTASLEETGVICPSPLWMINDDAEQKTSADGSLDTSATEEWFEEMERDFFLGHPAELAKPEEDNEALTKTPCERSFHQLDPHQTHMETSTGRRSSEYDNVSKASFEELQEKCMKLNFASSDTGTEDFTGNVESAVILDSPPYTAGDEGSDSIHASSSQLSPNDSAVVPPHFPSRVGLFSPRTKSPRCCLFPTGSRPTDSTRLQSPCSIPCSHVKGDRSDYKVLPTLMKDTEHHDDGSGEEDSPRPKRSTEILPENPNNTTFVFPSADGTSGKGEVMKEEQEAGDAIPGTTLNSTFSAERDAEDSQPTKRAQDEKLERTGRPMEQQDATFTICPDAASDKLCDSVSGSAQPAFACNWRSEECRLQPRPRRGAQPWAVSDHDKASSHHECTSSSRDQRWFASARSASLPATAAVCSSKTWNVQSFVDPLYHTAEDTPDEEVCRVQDIEHADMEDAAPMQGAENLLLTQSSSCSTRVLDVCFSSEDMGAASEEGLAGQHRMDTNGNPTFDEARAATECYDDQLYYPPRYPEETPILYAAPKRRKLFDSYEAVETTESESCTSQLHCSWTSQASTGVVEQVDVVYDAAWKKEDSFDRSGEEDSFDRSGEEDSFDRSGEEDSFDRSGEVETSSRSQSEESSGSMELQFGPLEDIHHAEVIVPNSGGKSPTHNVHLLAKASLRSHYESTPNKNLNRNKKPKPNSVSSSTSGEQASFDSSPGSISYFKFDEDPDVSSPSQPGSDVPYDLRLLQEAEEMPSSSSRSSDRQKGEAVWGIEPRNSYTLLKAKYGRDSSSTKNQIMGIEKELQERDSLESSSELETDSRSMAVSSPIPIPPSRSSTVDGPGDLSLAVALPGVCYWSSFYEAKSSDGSPAPQSQHAQQHPPREMASHASCDDDNVSVSPEFFEDRDGDVNDMMYSATLETSDEIAMDHVQQATVEDQRKRVADISTTWSPPEDGSPEKLSSPTQTPEEVRRESEGELQKALAGLAQDMATIPSWTDSVAVDAVATFPPQSVDSTPTPGRAHTKLLREVAKSSAATPSKDQPPNVEAGNALLHEDAPPAAPDADTAGFHLDAESAQGSSLVKSASSSASVGLDVLLRRCDDAFQTLLEPRGASVEDHPSTVGSLEERVSSSVRQMTEPWRIQSPAMAPRQASSEEHCSYCGLDFASACELFDHFRFFHSYPTPREKILFFGCVMKLYSLTSHGGRYTCFLCRGERDSLEGLLKHFGVCHPLMTRVDMARIFTVLDLTYQDGGPCPIQCGICPAVCVRNRDLVAHVKARHFPYLRC